MSFKIITHFFLCKQKKKKKIVLKVIFCASQDFAHGTIFQASSDFILLMLKFMVSSFFFFFFVFLPFLGPSPRPMEVPRLGV